MFVVLVYDTAVERNPAALRTCRQYLHWVQRSVFEGELSAAQHRSLITALRQQLDLSYDSIRMYRIGSPAPRPSRDARSRTRPPGFGTLTCTNTQPPDRCKTRPDPRLESRLDLRLKVRVAHHPWRDRNTFGTPRSARHSRSLITPGGIARGGEEVLLDDVDAASPHRDAHCTTGSDARWP
ncbi:MULTISPECIES: CRISPR-associated endonuclease Cas2 [unclassified Micromonospora]|uniref:CRISPR-associated endonuclease Cas2 n=1 Tax=unclassified Micromonospora TaxID=2617518 RepID=UPI00363D8523